MTHLLGLHNQSALDEIMAADADLGREIMAELAALNQGIVREGNIAREVDQSGYTLNAWFDDQEGTVRGPAVTDDVPLFDVCEILRDPPSPIDGCQEAELDELWQSSRHWQSRRHGNSR